MYIYIYISICVISVISVIFFIEERSVTLYSWQEQNMRDGKK